MGLSSTPVSFRSLGLLVLLVFAACAGGDRLDTPIRSAQRLGTPHWASGASVVVEQRAAVRVALSWPEAFGAEAPYAYAVYRDGELTHVMPVPVVTDEDVAASTSYVYAIAARDAEGRESDVSERLTVTVTTPGPSPAPEWPSGAALSVVRIGRNRAELAWPSGLPVAAGGDAYDECRYELQHRESGAMEWTSDGVLKETPAATEGALVTGLTAATGYEFRVLLSDLEAQPAAVGIAAVSATTASASAAFAWSSGASASATVVTRSVLRLSWPEGPLDAESYELERDLGAGFVDWATVPAGFQAATTFEGDGFEPRGTPYDLRVRAVDHDGATTAWLTASASITLPPTPTPPLPPTTGETSFADRASFLYEAPPGAVPQQTGVAAGTIVPTRSAILTGEVQRRDGATPVAVPGARISVLGHPEFGETWSRADGLWEMVVNGGTSLVVEIRKSGYLPVQRTVNVPWGEFARADDVLLTAEAATVPVALDTDGTVPDGGVGVQGPVVGSGSTQRRAAVFLPEGRTVTACLPGSTPEWCNAQQLTDTLNLSMTEYTVRDDDRAAMPGTLPPTSAYTYAASYRIAEAEALHATRVEFDGPVVLYVDNFLDFHLEGHTSRAGVPIPMGWYDPERGRWVPNEQIDGWTRHGSGRTIELLGVLADGRAELDVDGDGDADEPPGIGISDDERRWLATYVSGAALPRAASPHKSLWRVPIRHFTSVDLNKGKRPKPGAKFPRVPGNLTATVCPPTVVENSVIECENRTFGESIAVPGAGTSLHYHSTRSAAQRPVLSIPVTLEFAGVGAPTPRPNAAIVQLMVEGQYFHRTYVPPVGETELAADLVWDFPRCVSGEPTPEGGCWDGTDRLHHPVRGSARVALSVGYAYHTVYGATDEFGYNGDGRITDFVAGGGEAELADCDLRESMVLWTHTDVQMPQWDARSEALGGWTLAMHHRWDVAGQRVLRGDGGAFPVNPSRIADQAVRVAGAEMHTSSSVPDRPSVDDGLPALQAAMPGYGRMQFEPRGLAVDARGQVHVALEDGRIMRVDAEGRLRLVFDTVTGRGTGSAVSHGTPTAMAIAPDGTIYLAVLEHRVWRIRGTEIEAFAGNGSDPGTAVPGRLVAATSSALHAPTSLAVGANGLVYIAEQARGRIRVVDDLGMMGLFAGNSLQPGGAASTNCWWTGAAPTDNVPATETYLCLPTAIALGPDGSLYVAEQHAVSRIAPDGMLQRLAGATHPTSDCMLAMPAEGMLARDACLFGLGSIGVLPNGHVLLGMAYPHAQNAVFSIDPAGHLWRVAGTGSWWESSNGRTTRAALEPWLDGTRHIAVDGQGRPHVLTERTRSVWRLEGSTPDRVPGGDVVIDSPDGSERYTFSRDGRHLLTRDALNGTTRYTFGYDTSLRLATVTDAFSNAITVAHPTSTTFTLTGPHGAVSTGTLDGDGQLVGFDAGEWGETTLVYGGADGPLSAMRDPLARWHRYAHDSRGRFLHDSWATSATTDLTGGRLVSLNGDPETRTQTQLSWTVTSRDGTSLASGLDTVLEATRRDDGTETRVHTPPIGPAVTTDVQRVTASVRVGWSPIRAEPTLATVRSESNGLVWSRSVSAGYSYTTTPFDGQSRTDLRLGAASGGAFRLSTTRTVDVFPSDVTQRSDILTLTTEERVVDPGTSDALLALHAAAVNHDETGQRWRTTMERLSDGWRVTSLTPRDRSTISELDSQGRVRLMTPPPITQDGSALTQYGVTVTYDTRGRTATVTQNTRRVTYAYDDASTTPAERRGRLASVTVGSTETGGPSRTTTLAYNVGDVPRSMRTTAPGGIVHDVALDQAGNVTSLTPPGRTAHTFAYGWRNRPTSYSPPVPAGGGAAADWRTTYEHLVQGMPSQVSRPDGDFDFTYGDGRLGTVYLPAVSGAGRPSLIFTYDEATGGGSGTGVVTSVTHSVNGSLTYGYNFASTGTLPTSETWGVTEDEVTTSRAVSVTYDAFARVASWTATGGPTVALSYEGDGLLKTAGDLTITRDTTAGVELGTSLSAGSGSVTTTQRYNAYGEVTTRGSAYSGGAGLSFAYAYDAFGRLVHVTESGEGSDGDRWYRYDDVGRLARVCTTEDCGDGADGGVDAGEDASEDGGADGGVDGGASTELERYAYDANGTRTSWTNSAGTFSVASEDVDAQDRLLQFTGSGLSGVAYTYDHTGRTSTRVATATTGGVAHTTTLTYDSDGALKSFVRTGSGAMNITYRNDAAGRRIARLDDGTVTDRWIYQGIHPVAEYDASWTLRRVYVYATRGHVLDYVAQADGSGGWVLYRVITDHLGSLRRVVRVSDEVVVQRMRYDAYGRVRQDEVASGWEPLPFGYAGGIYDRATKLVRFGARDYDAEIGRWTAKDPIGFGGGDGNLYGYVGGDAVNSVDSTGHCLHDGMRPSMEGNRDEYRNLLRLLWRLPTNVLGGAMWEVSALQGVAQRILGDRDIRNDFGMVETSTGHSAIHVYNSWWALGVRGGRTVGNFVFFRGDQTSAQPRFAHEHAHIDQHDTLGPFYVPFHLSNIAYSYLTTGTYRQNNYGERGPYGNPPRPWP